MKKLFLIIFIIINILCFGYYSEFDHCSNKIVFEGFGQFTDMSYKGEIIDIIEEDKIEEIKLVIVGKSNFNFNVDLKEGLTDAEAEKIQCMRRKAGAAYYKEFNQELLKSIPEYNYKNVYVSKYFPQITLDVDANEVMSNNSSLLNQLSKIDAIDTIFVQNNDAIVDKILGAIHMMSVNDEIFEGTLTGSGVKVGMIESGIIDVDNTNFENITVEARDAWYFIEHVTEHATTMASCIGGKEGIARGASIYSVQGAGNPSGEIDWLLDKGVNVINCSYGYGTVNGQYSSHSATYDYAIWTYGVSVIAASGNEESDENDYYIANPGLAHNAITVGGAFDAICAWGYSCYQEVSDIDKPTLVSPADDIQTQNAIESGCGTSYSCALTTGCAALLMELCPDLKVYPAKLTALLSACAYDMNYPSDLESGLNDIIGAGLIDFAECKDSINNCISGTSSSTDQADDYIIDQDVYLEAGKELCIAVAWCGKSNDSVSSWQLNTYILCLFRPAGAQIDFKYSLYNNVLLLRYTTQYTGNYNILLIQEGDLVYSDPTNIFIYYSVRDVE